MHSEHACHIYKHTYTHDKSEFLWKLMTAEKDLAKILNTVRADLTKRWD